MRIFDLVSGVETWKVTPSKSETIWSMETGGALYLELAGVPGDRGEEVGNPPREPLREEGLQEDVLII